jgi:hypothetical protein
MFIKREKPGYCSWYSGLICGLGWIIQVPILGEAKGLCLVQNLGWNKGSQYSDATGWTVQVSNTMGDEIFHNRSEWPWNLPSLLYIGYQVIPRGTAARVWHWPPTLSITKVKEKVELYFYSPSGPLWLVVGWIVPLPCPRYPDPL